MTFDKPRAYGRVFARVRNRRVPDLVRLLAKRPAITAAVGTDEVALLMSSRVDSRLKTLAQIKSASLIGCPF